MTSKQAASARTKAITKALSQIQAEASELWRTIPPEKMLERQLLLGAEALQRALEHFGKIGESMEQQGWSEDNPTQC